MAALDKAMAECSSARRIAEVLYLRGYIIVPQGYKPPANRGGAREQIAAVNRTNDIETALLLAGERRRK